MGVEPTSIVDLPLPILDRIFARYSRGKAQKLALLASVCKTFSVPGGAVSELTIDDSVESKSEGAVNFDETQFRLSRLIHLAPNVLKVTSSVEVAPSTLPCWSKIVGETLTSLEIRIREPENLQVLHTFSDLKELKLTLPDEVLEKDVWKDFQDLDWILKLRLEIDDVDEEREDREDFDSFLKLFPGLFCLTVKSNHYEFVYRVSHLKIRFLQLECDIYDPIEIDCPNLEELRLVFESYITAVHLHERNCGTEVEIVAKCDEGEITFTCNVEKEEYIFREVPTCKMGGYEYFGYQMCRDCEKVKARRLGLGN